ncbi:glycosyltransferase [candidate division WOR-3 bacterium]|nr:glycosyltransferase [candidate division WOR-3 bacterium]
MKRSQSRADKTLLMITYYWPPLGGPGSLRPVKFAKYLPRFGIMPKVITRKEIAYHSYDRSLADDVPGIDVTRTDSFDPARILYRLGMRDYRVKDWHGTIKRAVNLPDNKLPWAPFAYHAGKKKDFDQIFVTAPPFSAFITGYYLAKSTGKPFIADFRDAWLEYPFMRYEGSIQKGFARYWEEKVVASAKCITVVDENIERALTARYPQRAGKISVIPNGFDPDDFAQTVRSGVFTISYLGTIRPERDPENVLRAVGKFCTMRRIGADKIRFKFIGHVEERFLRRMRNNTFVETIGHLPYKDAIREFCNSHLAVMITTGSEYFFPSRQQEYLASGLPVIVCGKSKGLHVMADAFKEGYPGWTFDFDDIEGMSKKIYHVYQKWATGSIIEGKTPYKEYTRENLTGVLAGLIRQKRRS